MNSGTKNLLNLQSTEFSTTRVNRKYKSKRTKIEAIERLRKKLNIQVLRGYDSRKRRYGAESVVPVRENTCSGCHVSVSRETLRRAQLGGIIECQHCGRLLYGPKRRYVPLKISITSISAYMDCED